MVIIDTIILNRSSELGTPPPLNYKLYIIKVSKYNPDS